MNRYQHSLVLIISVAILGGAVFGAQSGGNSTLPGGRSFPPGLGGAIGFAGFDPIQTELGLDPAAITKVNLDEFAEESKREWESSGLPADYQELGLLGPKDLAEKRREISQKTSAIGKKLDDRFRPRLKSALSSAQYRRFQQIVWQWDGSRSLADDPELIATLKISSEQKKAIADLNQDIRQRQAEVQRRVFEAGGANGPSKEDMRALVAKMQEIDKARDKKAVELLSKKQQVEYSALKGEPFDFAKFRTSAAGEGTNGSAASKRKDK